MSEPRSCKLHNPAGCDRVAFQLLENVENDIFAADAGEQVSGEDDVDALGYLDPCLARDEGNGDVCYA